jgi:predicted PurR-regulated permease PerM
MTDPTMPPLQPILVPDPGPPRQRRDLHIPMSTILKLIGSGLGVWAAFKLWPGFLLFLIALVFAVTLNPAVAWMERRRVPRGLGVLAIAGSAVGVLLVIGMFVMPPLTTQFSHLLGNFPTFRAEVLSRISGSHPLLQRTVAELFELPTSPEVSRMLQQSLVWGQAALSGVAATAIVLVLTVYLLLNGRSMYAWLLAFVPRTHREKMAITTDQVSDVVQAYVGGQLLAVVLFAGFTVVVLNVFGVPAVVPLAIIAGLCDVIPVLGIILATVPAVLLALTVSPMAALGVAVAYLGYHMFETYFLLPKIYGTKLRLSTLSVLMALMVGMTLQGIVGAALVLPLVAAYPIIERHWLVGLLQSRVIKDHHAMAKAAETGSDVAIDAVMQGEKHASETKLQRQEIE